MITDEPARGRYAYLENPGLLGLSGLEQFRPFLAGEVPLAPLYHHTGLRVTEVGPGTATFEMPASPWWRSGAGVFLAGVFPYVADAALGCAIYTTLPSGKMLATSQLSVSFLRPAGVGSERLVARANLVQVGRSQGVSEARVTGSDGSLLAHATTRCVILDLPFEPQPPPERWASFEPETHPTPDPYLRESVGQVVPPEELDEGGWLDVYRRWIKGDLPLPPFLNLTGIRPAEIEEGRGTWTMPASEWYASAYRSFYGGAIAMLADAALTGAAASTVGGRTAIGTLDLTVHFLRPVEPDGQELVAHAEVVHRGRRTAVATAHVEDARGRRVAVATSSSFLMHGRRWDEGGLVPIDEASSDDG